MENPVKFFLIKNVFGLFEQIGPFFALSQIQIFQSQHFFLQPILSYLAVNKATWQHSYTARRINVLRSRKFGVKATQAIGGFPLSDEEFSLVLSASLAVQVR